MGNKTVTIKNSEILFINVEENILVLKGSLPGKKNSVLKSKQKNNFTFTVEFENKLFTYIKYLVNVWA